MLIIKTSKIQAPQVPGLLIKILDLDLDPVLGPKHKAVKRMAVNRDLKIIEGLESLDRNHN